MVIEKTNRTRYRIQTRWFQPPVLVLQLEYLVTREEHWSEGDCKILPDRLIWKDAKTEDITLRVNNEQ